MSAWQRVPAQVSSHNGRTCNTKHAMVAKKVDKLPELAAVLRTHKAARRLLLVRLHAAKVFGAEWSSGGHRLGK
eukprot:4851020-Prymnesium_polylepis.1